MSQSKPLYCNYIFWTLLSYFLFIIIYTICFIDYEGKNRPLSSNELGDFLAGIFAPLAFFFLYLGYRQQAEQLKQNTKALEHQAKSLDVQINELKVANNAYQRQIDEMVKSVDQQQKISLFYEREQEEKHFQVLPFFTLKDHSADKYSRPMPIEDDEGNIIETVEEEVLEVSFTLINQGDLAKNILIENIKDEPYFKRSKYKIDHNEEYKIKFEFDGQIIEYLEKGGEIDNTLILTYKNIYGRSYKNRISLSLYAYADFDDATTYFPLSIQISSSEVK